MSLFSAKIDTIASIISTFISSAETVVSSIDNKPSRLQNQPVMTTLFALRRRLLKMGRNLARCERGEAPNWMGETESIGWFLLLRPITLDIAREMKNIRIVIGYIQGDQGY
jgi:hypothetical protein